MARKTMFQLCAVKIGATVIGQITSQNLQQQFEKLNASDSASIYKRAGGIHKTQHRISFTTEACKVGLGACGLAGTLITVAAPVVFYLKQLDHGGGIAASGCVTYTATDGIAVWRSVEAPKTGAATVTFDVFPVSTDGSTAPLEKATGVALPAITTTEMWVCGTAGVETFSLNTGITELLESDPADDYNTLAAITGIFPTVQATYNDGGDLAAKTLGSLKLIEVEHGGRRGDSEITFTFNKELTLMEGLSGPSQYNGELFYDGTRLPVVVALPA